MTTPTMIETMLTDLMAFNNLKLIENEMIGGWVATWADDRGRERTTIFTLCPHPDPDLVSISIADRSPVFHTWSGCSSSLNDIQHAVVRFVVSEK